MDAKFSIETHRYVNGMKPAWIMPIFGGWASCDAIDGSRGASSLIVHNVDGSCVSGYDSRMQRDLVPIPPKPEVAYWSKPEDVDPLIDRLKYRRDCDTTSRISLGAPVVCIGKGGLIVCSVLTTYDGSEPEPMADLIAWKKLTECEYRRIGEATWWPCSNTTTSEGV